MVGAAATVSGTPTAGAIASTSYRTSLPRVVTASALTAGAVAGVRISGNVSRWRGSAVGLGGFEAVLRFGLSIAAGHQVFVGVTPTALLAGEPSALLNSIGLSADTADTALFWMSRDGTTVTRTTTGVLKTSTDVFRVRLFCAPNGTAVSCHLYNETTQTVVSNISQTLTLPVNTTFMSPTAQVRNGATTTAATIDIVRLYANS